MPKIIFILGLAGSGKSHLANQIHRETGASCFEGIVGDTGEMARMLDHLQRGGDCVIEEIAYLLPSNRERIVADLTSRFPGIEISWECFENDVDAANWNVERRTNKGSPGNHMYMNSVYQALYIYPGAATPRKIFRLPAKSS